jgi:hydroxymethylbilane synthase
MRELVIGTRGSALALWQAHAIEAMVREHAPDVPVRLEIIHTTGDRILDSPLNMIGDKGLFTKELESALYDRRINIAVHSLKDIPTQLPEGLIIGAITRRHHPEDVLVAAPGTTIDNLPSGATVATGSLRRRAQLLYLRPDLHVVDVRGNVPTRLEKYQQHGWAGMILAFAGLDRLGLASVIAQVIPSGLFVPAVGQGAIAIEARADDDATLELLAGIEHTETRLCITAERALLRRLEGGCQVPIGAHATIDGGTINLTGIIASIDGGQLVRDVAQGPVGDGEQLGTELAERLLDAGGREILEAMRQPQ